MPASSFGTKLRRLRKAAGMTQAELAKRAGCNPVSISQYEAGIYEPRDERATTLIELVRGGSHPPEELKAAAPKKRGRPRKTAEPGKEKPRKPRRRAAWAVKPETIPGPAAESDQVEARVTVSAKGPVRLGSVTRAWIEQQADAYVHTRGWLIVDGQARFVTIRRADLVDLAATILGACGTRVE